MNWRSIYDRFQWLAIGIGFHPFHWRLELDRDARDKSIGGTLGPISIQINW